MENRAADMRERLNRRGRICFSIYSFPISIFSLEEGL